MCGKLHCVPITSSSKKNEGSFTNKPVLQRVFVNLFCTELHYDEVGGDSCG